MARPIVGQKVVIVPGKVSDRKFNGVITSIEGDNVQIQWNGTAKTVGTLSGSLPGWSVGAKWEVANERN